METTRLPYWSEPKAIVKVPSAASCCTYTLYIHNTSVVLPKNQGKLLVDLLSGGDAPVSYTHLDVYKRQVLHLALISKDD